MDLTPAFSPINAFWSLMLFAIVLWKLRRLREEIHTLAGSLRNLGDPFIRRELAELKEDVESVQARMTIAEEALNISGCSDHG